MKRGKTNGIVERVHAAALFIEENLGERITVGEIARRACYSPFHFHRTFSAIKGEPVMEYVRRRQLSIAARRLGASEDPIIHFALDCGFDSQEAFTRAFKQQFAVPPGRFRKAGERPGLAYRPAWTLDALKRQVGETTMQPKFVDLPELCIIGLAGPFTVQHTEGIPDLWQRFCTAWEGASLSFPDVSYGICYDEGEGDGFAGDDIPFTYMAAFPAEGVSEVPEGLEEKTVPANSYAVFTTADGVAGLKAAYAYIFGTWMAESGHRRGEGPDFELYDDRFDPETMTGEIDIYVPVVTV